MGTRVNVLHATRGWDVKAKKQQVYVRKIFNPARKASGFARNDVGDLRTNQRQQLQRNGRPALIALRWLGGGEPACTRAGDVERGGGTETQNQGVAPCTRPLTLPRVRLGQLAARLHRGWPLVRGRATQRPEVFLLAPSKTVVDISSGQWR
jgi:hypothetical protein